MLIAILGGCAVHVVRAQVSGPGDTATTAGKVVAHGGLGCMGAVADLFQATVLVWLG